MSFSKMLKKDKKYKTLLRILEEAQERINVEKDRAEAFSLHSGLEVRSLYGKNVFSTKRVLQADAQLQANRSRLVAMRTLATQHISYLQQGCVAYRRHCFATYDFSDYRNKEERDSILDKPLRPALDFIAEVTILMDMIDMFIKDIDQSGHTIRRIIDVHKLLDSSKTGR